MASLATPLATLTADAQAMQSNLNPSADALKLCGKVVANVVKNGAEPKFRRINLAGKAGAKLTAAPASVELLKALGFVDAGDGHLELPAAVAADSLAAASAQIAAAVETLPPPAPAAEPAPVKTYVPPPTLSLKQKALLMQEEKDKAKRENEKRLRQEELQKFKRDTYARQNDENWSAAAAGVKGGKEIGTYRDQFGEEGGGGG